MRIFVTALSLFLLGGCASNAEDASATEPVPEAAAPSTEGGEDPGSFGNRPVTGSCMATYREDADATLVAVEVPEVGVTGAILLGDDWNIACPGEPTTFVFAENRASGRIVSVTLDPGVREPVDVEAYAAGQAEHTAAAIRAQGGTVEAGEPQMMGEGVYAIAFRVRLEELNVLQLNAYHVLPTPVGLLRYHISETGEDPATLNEHGTDLVRAATAFSVMAPDAS